MKYLKPVLCMSLGSLALLSNASRADIATEYCESFKGKVDAPVKVKTYIIEDQEKRKTEVELCWIGDGAIGTWTLYKFHKPSSEGDGLGRIIDFKKNSNLTLRAVNSYIDNSIVHLTDEEIAKLEETAVTVAPLTTDDAPLPTKKDPSVKKPPVELQTEVINPSFKACVEMGGQPFRLKSTSVVAPKPTVLSEISGTVVSDMPSVSPATITELISPERSENPKPAVCFFENNSAIEIWTLWYGPEHKKTAAFNEVLFGNY